MTALERAVETLMVIQLGVIGFSHVVHRRAWAEFFIWLRSKGDTGAFLNGFLSLTSGSLILGFHRVWSGIPLVLTVFGVLNLLKAANCFLLPASATRSMNRVSVERSYEFVVAGAVSLALSGLVAFHLLPTARRMTRSLEIFAVIHLALIGLSHVVRHRAWAEFFINLRARRCSASSSRNERWRTQAFVSGFAP